MARLYSGFVPRRGWRRGLLRRAGWRWNATLCGTFGLLEPPVLGLAGVARW